MPSLAPRPERPTIRGEHPLWRDGPPVFALFPTSAATGARDLMGHAWTPGSAGVVAAATPWGRGWRFGGSNSYLRNTTAVLPTTACTILVVVAVPGGESASGFGTLEGDANGTLPGEVVKRLQCHLTFGDAIYWDFGGGTGANRISTSVLGGTAGWNSRTSFHRLALRAGPRGSSIWYDGRLVTSQATAITRTAGLAGYEVGGWSAGGYASTNVYDSFHLYPRELPDAAILGWMADPYEHVRPRRMRVIYSAGGGGSFQAAWASQSTLMAGVP